MDTDETIKSPAQQDVVMSDPTTPSSVVSDNNVSAAPSSSVPPPSPPVPSQQPTDTMDLKSLQSLTETTIQHPDRTQLPAQLLTATGAALEGLVGSPTSEDIASMILSNAAVNSTATGTAVPVGGQVSANTPQTDLTIPSVPASSASTPSVISGGPLDGSFAVFDMAAATSTSNSPIVNLPASAKQDSQLMTAQDLHSMASVPGIVVNKVDDPTPMAQSGSSSTSQSTTKVQLNWQEILISLITELGFVESSRMMEVEQLVLSRQQRQNAPGIVEKYSRMLQESVSGQSVDLVATKRHNQNSMDIDNGTAEGLDAIKRRRMDSAESTVQANPTREEIESKMVEFMAAKREQINESNRQEFTNGRAMVMEGELSDASTLGDDGCARVDARKLNRTIQMKLETVKNEALTKTNPKTHGQMNVDPNLVINGLDERLKNIQTHLNLRLAASPACSISERIRVVEDVIIQLERDYPVWSAVHFNQPNRVFPPPPAVTTVTRNSRNQIVMTGGHLATTLIDNGDLAYANAATSAQYSNIQSPPPTGTPAQRAGSSGSAIVNHSVSTTGRQVLADSRVSQAVPGAPTNSNATGASNTVIKLKRHGGAGSSSLARAVQQQLAQRKAAASASGGHVIDETKNNGAGHASLGSPTMRSGPGSSSSPSSSLSPTIGFTDPLKPGVTGRGPIKSRRKSIAKGLDPAMGSTIAAHATGAGVNSGFAGNNGGVPGTMNLASDPSVKAKPAAARKPRKKKDENSDDPMSPTKPIIRTGVGRGKAGGGLGKGKGGRPMGMGLGKGKGGAYREEMMRRAEVEEFDDDDSEDDIDDDFESGPTPASRVISHHHGAGVSGGLSSNGSLIQGSNTFATDNSALAHLVSSALQDQANSQAQAQQRQQLLLQQQLLQRQQAQQIQQQQQQQQQDQGDALSSQQTAKAKKHPRKPSTPQKPPPVRKFGGKSFGMAGGESSGSSSNESSDGEGSGSSGSQSESSSGSISGSDPGDSD
ncbi:hypothetical protein BGZ83_006859 [Gryganskiella cystojenkinii]|nr:hypothetical protein BGZ83_006859 [Gryganskiella cystojenkinii]